MYTLGYRFRPWAEREGDRRRPVDPRLHARDGRARTASTPHPLRPPGPRRVVVDATRRAGPSTSSAPTPASRSQLTCGFLLAAPATTATTRATRRSSRASSASAGRSPSAVLARGPRLRRQAGRRDRQRRDRGDARAGDGARPPRTSRCSSARRPTSSRCPARTRSPTALRRVLPTRLAYVITRWKNVADARRSSQLASAGRELVKGFVRAGVKRRLPQGYRRRHALPPDATTRGTQRVCLVPDSDLFEAISDGRAEMVTDTHRDVHRDRHPPESGRELEADIVVTATGPEPARVRRASSSPSTARRSCSPRR